MSCLLWVCISLASFLFPGNAVLAATRTWNNAAGGSWQNHLNWSPNGTPAAGDDVVITLDGTYTITLDGTSSIGTLTLGLDSTSHIITLNLNSGSLTLASTSQCRTRSILRVSGGTLNVNGSLTVNGTCQISAGALNANNSVVVNGPLALSGGALNASQSAVVNGSFSWTAGQVLGTGTLEVTGDTTWNAGTMGEAGTTRVASSGLLTLDGASDKILNQRRLVNLGVLRWRGTGRFLVQGGGLITNAATFQIENASTILGSLGTGTVFNAGTLVKQNNTGTAVLDSVAFGSRGTVDAQNGILQIKSGGTNAGTLNAGLLGRIDLTGGTMHFDSGTQIQGVGTTRLAGATLIIRSNDIALKGNFQQESGTLTGDGALLNSTGTYNWLGGIIGGTGSVVNSSIMNIAGAGDLTLAGRRIVSYGTINWSSNGNLRADRGTLVDNSGTFNILNNRAFRTTGAGTGDPPLLINFGLIRKTSTAETLFDGWTLEAWGTIDTQAGVFRFPNGTHKFLGVFTRPVISGAGLFMIDGATFVLVGPGPDLTLTVLIPGNIQLNSGSIDHSGEEDTVLETSGTFTWTGGTFGGAPELSPLRITSAGTLFISGPNLKSSARIISNSGTIIWTGTGNLHVTPVLANGNLFLVQNDALMTGGLVAGGILRKIGTTGRSRFNIELSGGGIVDVVTGIVDFQAYPKLNPLTGEPLTSTIQFAPQATGMVEMKGTYFLAGTNFSGAGLTLITNTMITTRTGRVVNIGGNVRMVEPSTLLTLGTNRIIGIFDWQGGLITGTTGRTEVLPSGTLRLSGPLTKTNDTIPIINRGTLHWTETGNFQLTNGGHFANSNLFLIQNNARLEGLAKFFGFPGSVIRKSTATGMSLIESVTVEQSGTFDIQSGQLYFKSGDHFLFKDCDITGLGTLGITGAVVNILEPTAQIPMRGNFEFAGGTLGGSGGMDVSGNFVWRHGVFEGSGPLKVSTSGILTIAGSLQKQINGRSLTNVGTINWDGLGTVESSGMTFENAGQLNLRGNVTWLHSGGSPSLFRNVGDVVRDPGTGTTLWQDVIFENAGTIQATSGILRIEPGYTQSAGSTVLNGGVIRSSLVQLNGGELRGVGTLTGSVVNAAFVRPGLSTGLLKISGSYTQTAAGALVMELNGTTPLTQYDRLEVLGNAVLAGKLQIVRTNEFMPTTNDTFLVLTSGDRAGVFHPVTGRALTNGTVLSPFYSAGTVTLRLGDITPQFSSQPPQLLDGELRIRLEGPEGEEYIIEYSQNLQTWIPLTTNSVTGTGYMEVSDPAPTLWPRRFYRARFRHYDE